MLAMNRVEMNTTRQLDDPGQNRRLDNITGGQGSSQTHGLYIGELAVAVRAAAMEFGWQGGSP
jgi:hypothetical protein